MKPSNAVMMSLGLLLIGTTAALSGVRTTGSTPQPTPGGLGPVATAVRAPMIATLRMLNGVHSRASSDATAMLTLHASQIAGVLYPERLNAVAIVLDVSGSMLGDKLRDAKTAAAALVDSLPDGDRVTIVSFADQAEVHVRNLQVGPNRHVIKSSLEEISVRGTTCISCGLGKAYDVVRGLSGVQPRVILLSDGQANQGVQGARALGKLARAERDRGVTTTTIGLGAGYDARVMKSVAVNGAGRYYFAHNANAIGAILEAERHQLAHAVVRNVRVRFRGVNGVQVATEEGAEFRYRHVSANTSRSLGVRMGRMHHLGTMSADSERRILVRLSMPAGLEGKVLVAEVSFEDMAGTQQRFELAAAVRRSDDPVEIAASQDRAVVAHRARVAHLTTVDAAFAAKEAGKDEEAGRLLQKAARQLDAAADATDDASVRAEAGQVRVLMKKMKSFAPGSKELEATKRINGARAEEIQGGLPASQSFHSNGMYNEQETQ